jgi:hypothetical protein
MNVARREALVACVDTGVDPIKITPLTKALAEFSQALKTADENPNKLNFDNLNKKFQKVYNSAQKIFKMTNKSEAFSELTEDVPNAKKMQDRTQKYNQSQKELSTDEVMSKTKILLDRLGLSEDFLKLNTILSNREEMQRSGESKQDVRIKFRTINKISDKVQVKLLDLIKNNFGDDFNQPQSTKTNVEERNRELSKNIKELISAAQKSARNLNLIANPAAHMPTTNKPQSGVAKGVAIIETKPSTEGIGTAIIEKMAQYKTFKPVAVKNYPTIIMHNNLNQLETGKTPTNESIHKAITVPNFRSR